MSEARPGLSLRARLLIGLAIVAAIAIGVAATVTVTTHSYLVQQLDERLESYSGPTNGWSDPHDGGSNGPDLSNEDDEESAERPSEAFAGVIGSDGVLRLIFAPNTSDAEDSTPAIDVDDLSTTETNYLTVDSESGEQGAYRVLAAYTEGVNQEGETVGGWIVVALSMDSVNDATTQLILIETLGIVALLAGLSLVGLWVIRLGITPMRQMVDASKQIAEGDMSVRLEGASAGSESHDLAIALNSMIGRLTASLAERERSEAKLREFVADASHELRTPLTTVLGYAQLYRIGALAEKAEVDDAWNRTEAEAGRMKRLVEDMLELAKFDALPELQRVDTDISAIAPDKVRQAILNIVRNAAVHGGDHVVVRVTATEGAVRIAVEDDGPGMTPEVAARATERFVRGDSSRSRASGGGSGLGLAITAAIVDAHGGTLAVSSAVGQGTTVTLTIPRAPLTTGAMPVLTQD